MTVGRIGLLSTEPLRPAMAGIGVRYLEMARALDAAGVEVVIVDPGHEELEVPGTRRRFEPGRLGDLFSDCRAVVAQGQLANDLVLACPGLPTAIDLYDPWMIENFSYLESLGLDPYRNDHATWVLQMSRGDFFLCSSEEQRRYYLGFLTALGRVHPRWPADDPDRRRLVDVVPFGLPETIPAHRPWLDDEADGPRLLFGGLYDWYDPMTVLEGLATLADRPWSLYVVVNPNQASTPQSLFGRVEAWCRQRDWWGSRVRPIEWVPAERRWDLLRDVDGLVALARPGLEAELSMRTRFLEALAVGCPVVVSEGGTVSRLIAEAGAGWVVPDGRPARLADAVVALLDSTREREERVARGRDLARRFRWDEVLAPLVAFARDPWRDDTKESFAFQPGTRAPADDPGFRVRRRVRRWLDRSDG